MPARPRVVIPEAPLHIVQRGHNRAVCFVDDSDRLQYLNCLSHALKKSGCSLHAYVLMTNHVHLLLTPPSDDAAAVCMMHLGQRYVRYYNRKYKRTGTLWESRYKSSLICDEAYLIACQRYIELNPVRAGMVQAPADYFWSSYAANARGHADALITPHPLFAALTSSAQARKSIYRELLGHDLSGAQTQLITDAVFASRPLR